MVERRSEATNLLQRPNLFTARHEDDILNRVANFGFGKTKSVEEKKIIFFLGYTKRKKLFPTNAGVPVLWPQTFQSGRRLGFMTAEKSQLDSVSRGQILDKSTFQI